MRKRVLLIVAAIAVVAGAFGLGLAMSGDDDDGGDDASEVTTTTEGDGDDGTTTTEAGDGSSTTNPDGTDDEDAPELTGTAGELQDAIEVASDLAYHARFEGTALAEDGSTTNYSVEVYRRPPDTFRRDTIVSRPEGTLNVREYLVGGVATVCFDQDSTGQYTCQPPPEGQAITPGAALFGAIDPAAGNVTHEGGCYRVQVSETETAEVCFDDDGIPTLIDDGNLRLERTLVELGVEDADFVPPA